MSCFQDLWNSLWRLWRAINQLPLCLCCSSSGRALPRASAATSGDDWGHRYDGSTSLWKELALMWQRCLNCPTADCSLTCSSKSIRLCLSFGSLCWPRAIATSIAIQISLSLSRSSSSESSSSKKGGGLTIVVGVMTKRWRNKICQTIICQRNMCCCCWGWHNKIIYRSAAKFFLKFRSSRNWNNFICCADF